MFQYIKDWFRGYELGARSSRWRYVRRDYLKEHPRCEMCKGKKGLEVHHIRPVHLYPDLEEVVHNLITLCGWRGYSCHFIWGHLKNYKDWNGIIREDAKHLSDRVK